MAKVQKTYTREFKEEAVRLAQSSGKPITHIARELGMSDTSIHQWRRELTAHGSEAFPGSGHQTALEEENRRLKRELERVQQERDILKKPHNRISPNDELMQRELKQPVERFFEQSGTERFPDEGQVPSARSRVVVTCQVLGRERDIGTGSNVLDNRSRNLVGRYGIAQALENLQVDEKAKCGNRALRGAMSQEDLSGCRRVNLVEFFGRQ
jgi:transposase